MAASPDLPPIFHSGSDTAALLSHHVWTQADSNFAKMFRPWVTDDQVKGGVVGGLTALNELNETIVAFDEYIGHSDRGFSLFRERHKWAMDKGQCDEAGWPAFRRTGGWDDSQWDIRYRWLVFQRQQRIKERLRVVYNLTDRACDDFFGRDLEPPRKVFQVGLRGNMSRQQRCHWYKDVSKLLTRMAARDGLPADETVQKFWNPGYKQGREEEEGEAAAATATVEEDLDSAEETLISTPLQEAQETPLSPTPEATAQMPIQQPPQAFARLPILGPLYAPPAALAHPQISSPMRQQMHFLTRRIHHRQQQHAYLGEQMASLHHQQHVLTHQIAEDSRQLTSLREMGAQAWTQQVHRSSQPNTVAGPSADFQRQAE